MRLTRARSMMLSLILVLLAACGPAPAATVPDLPGTETASAAITEPAKVISGDSLTISLPTQKNESYDQYQDYVTRLQALLYAAGWKVNLALLPYTVPDGQSGDDSILYAIRTQAAAGGAPDAWHVTTDLAKQLRAEGLTRDMADVLPKAASMLWVTCDGAFTGAVDGVPMSLETMSKFGPFDGPIVLLMSTKALADYGQPIANAEDILTYLEKTTDALIYDQVSLLTDAWAAQQGYYTLNSYGLPMFFYARQDDPDCKIVPVEDIPGFWDFYARCTPLRAQKRLRKLGDDNSAKLNGMLDSLRKGTNPSFMQASMGLMGKDITAVPLDGCNPSPAADAPIINNMLAVAAGSAHAQTVAAFAQWALLDPKGNDLCTLGKPSKDYRIVGDRVEYLKAGEPLAPADWNYSSTSSAFFLNGSSFAFNQALQRFTVYDVSNADEVFSEYHAVTPPIWKAKALRADSYALQSQFSPARQSYEDLLTQRINDLLLINNAREFTPQQLLQQLQDNRPKLDPLIQGLSAKLQELLNNPG